MTTRLSMLCYSSVSALMLMLCVTNAGHAADALSPRAEVNMRAGTERSLLMTEFWAPLAQQSDRVVYGDLRLMGDSDDNREGNLGFGYRQISKKTNSVLGANAWIDRRRTENGNNFHQLTLGMESLGDKIDLRANGYIQLNNSKTTITPNIGSSTPYLAGSGIYYDTNGFIVEEPQDGFDAEIGYRIPVLEKHIDATRVYAGGYHFFGDTTDNVTGFRLRTEAQVNSIFSVGARFQHDGPRGSQGFLEATLRFPFKSKKLFQQDGLKSRLDESPERDIDIVTGSKVDNGLMKPVLNASGTQQRILYVDNTNANAGDGAKDNPFNTLKAAEAALQANDIIYVNHGNGTTSGMDQGVVIDKDNVQLIGSGSALTYNGFTLLDAGLAPTITNIIPVVSGSELVGNGVLVLADNSVISGLTISGTQGYGIRIAAVGSNTIFSNAIVTNNTISGTKLRGVIIHTQSGGQINNVLVDNNRATANTGPGIHVQANTGYVGNITITNNSSANNTSDGLTLSTVGIGKLGAISVLNNTASANGGNGISASGNIETLSIKNNTTNGNTANGFTSNAAIGQIMNNIVITDLTANNNGSNGVYLLGTGSIINSINLQNIIANSNQNGININMVSSTLGSLNLSNAITNNNRSTGTSVFANTNGIIGSVTFTDITSNNNSSVGLNLLAYSSGMINNSTISNVTTNSNGSFGLFLQATTTGKINNMVIKNAVASNNINDGIRFDSRDANSLINQVSIENAITANNRIGVNLASLTSGTISNVALTNITSSGNSNNGFSFDAQTSSVMNGILLSTSTSTANALYGVFVNDDTTGTFLADLGGGVLNGVGLNRIFGNTNSDIRVDVDSGQLKAQNNWWGVNTGLSAGKVSYEDASTIDSTAFLITDPRP